MFGSLLTLLKDKIAGDAAAELHSIIVAQIGSLRDIGRIADALERIEAIMVMQAHQSSKDAS